MHLAADGFVVYGATFIDIVHGDPEKSPWGFPSSGSRRYTEG